MRNRDRESYPKYHMQLIDYLDEIVNLGGRFGDDSDPLSINLEVCREIKAEVSQAILSFGNNIRLFETSFNAFNYCLNLPSIFNTKAWKKALNLATVKLSP